jgi:hypothetical protein
VLALGRLRLIIAFAAAFGAMPVAASAQGRLDASYSVTLAGIPIGKGDWTIDISDTHYTATASGKTTGLMHVLTGGQGETSAHGTFANGQLQSATYLSNITSHKKLDSIRLVVDDGNVKETKIDPPTDPDPERVPITDAQQHGIYDPMSATLTRVPGTGDVVSQEACQRTVPIFDGRIRYDLQMSYKRMEQVKIDKGYAGPAVVCAVYFTPIGGYVPSRMAIRYITKMRDMEIWLAPIAGTRVLVPIRAQGPTPLGPVVMAADKFVSLATPAKASANGSKTQ